MALVSQPDVSLGDTFPPICSDEPAGFGLLAPLASRHWADGEFGWGGTSARPQRRCPKVASVRTEISRGAQAQRAA